MNEHTKYIEGLSLKALKTISRKDPPAPVKEIAEKFNLRVVEFDFPDNLSAVLKTEKQVIGVNKNHHPVRRRFSIAHELGHFLLNHATGKSGDFIDSYFEKPISMEREANIFASFLLMPKEWVKKAVARHGIENQNIKKLSKLFEVSEQAFIIRLLELNLIK